jgi:hypothetical protein
MPVLQLAQLSHGPVCSVSQSSEHARWSLYASLGMKWTGQYGFHSI